MSYEQEPPTDMDIWNDLQRQIDQLRSENERLIAKIKELANYELEIFEHRHLSQCAYDIRDIAREALNEVTK